MPTPAPDTLPGQAGRQPPLRQLPLRHPPLAILCASAGVLISFNARSFDTIRGASFHTHVAQNASRASRWDPHLPVIYGHVHMAKTGGTTLNGIFANKFERICGHKGYSYDAYGDNEKAKRIQSKGQRVNPNSTGGRGKVNPGIMRQIGYEDCDWVSIEGGYRTWNNSFPGGNLHGVPVELHVPCRDPVDHLMSQCNYGKLRKLDCDAVSNENFFESLRRCFVRLDRFGDKLLGQFNVKCYDFEGQFTAYADFIARTLQRRRFESAPFVRRETNRPRNRTDECIWKNATLLSKARGYLTDEIDYYRFCERCMGSENEIAGVGQNAKDAGNSAPLILPGGASNTTPAPAAS